MNYSQTVNNINKSFYQEIHHQFDTSRKVSWEGWEILVKKLGRSLKDARILDVGAGNLRFLRFILSYEFQGSYTAFDNSEELLLHGISDLEESKLINPQGKEHILPYSSSVVVNSDQKKTPIFIEQLDIVEDQTGVANLASQFSPELIVLFGVMHHIPDRDTRKSLLKLLSDSLANNGNLVFTTWEFLSDDRYKSRLLSTEEIAERWNGLKLNENDYILDWRMGDSAYRFCHAYTEDEVLELLEECNLQLVDSYLADGRNKKLNKYYICRKSF